MNIRPLSLTLGLLILFLIGCTTTQSNYLNRDALSRNKIALIEARVTNSHLEFDLNSAFRGEQDIGILSGLMDAVANKTTKVKRSGQYIKIRDSLNDLDIYSELVNKLTERSSGGFFVTPVKIIQVLDEDHIPKIGAPFLTLSYSMSQNFRFVTIVLELLLDQNEVDGKSYRRIYSSIQTLENVSSENWEHNAQQWIDKPSILKHRIDEGLNSVIKKFVKDFSPTK